jgi:hypothetical protein
MQVVHETVHVIVARVARGEVFRVALHPLIISRTNLAGNPHPLAVVWSVLMLGCLISLSLFGLAVALRTRGLFVQITDVSGKTSGHRR